MTGRDNSKKKTSKYGLPYVTLFTLALPGRWCLDVVATRGGEVKVLPGKILDFSSVHEAPSSDFTEKFLRILEGDKT